MNYLRSLARIAVAVALAVAAAAVLCVALAALAPAAAPAMAATGHDDHPLAAGAPQPGGSPTLFVVGGKPSVWAEPAVQIFRLRPPSD